MAATSATTTAAAATPPQPAATGDDVVTQQRVSPEYTANPLSRLTFAWLEPLFRAANSRPGLTEADLLRISDKDDVAAVSARFEQVMREVRDGGHPTPMRAALVRQFWGPMAAAGVIKFVNSTVQLLPPILLNLLLERIADRVRPSPTFAVWQGYVIAACMFLALSLRTLIENAYFHRVMRVGFQLRSAVTTAVYAKALRMSPVARQVRLSVVRRCWQPHNRRSGAGCRGGVVSVQSQCTDECCGCRLAAASAAGLGRPAVSVAAFDAA